MTDRAPSYKLAVTETGARIHCVDFDTDSIFAKVHGTNSLSLCLLFEDFEEVTYHELTERRFCQTCRNKIEAGKFEGSQREWQIVLDYNEEHCPAPDDDTAPIRKETA